MPSTLDTVPDGGDDEVRCYSQHCLAKHANYIKETYTPEVSVLFVFSRLLLTMFGTTGVPGPLRTIGTVLLE